MNEYYSCIYTLPTTINLQQHISILIHNLYIYTSRGAINLSELIISLYVPT